MKNKKSMKLLLGLLMIAVVTMLPSIAMAQVTDPGCPDCPIDGGLSLLIAAGVGYGVKRYRGLNKAD